MHTRAGLARLAAMIGIAHKPRHGRCGLGDPHPSFTPRIILLTFLPGLLTGFLVILAALISGVVGYRCTIWRTHKTGLRPARVGKRVGGRTAAPLGSNAVGGTAEVFSGSLANAARAVACLNAVLPELPSSPIPQLDTRLTLGATDANAHGPWPGERATYDATDRDRLASERPQVAGPLTTGSPDEGSHAEAAEYLLVIGVIRDRRGMRRGAEATCLGSGCARRALAQRPTTVGP